MVHEQSEFEQESYSIFPADRKHFAIAILCHKAGKGSKLNTEQNLPSNYSLRAEKSTNVKSPSPVKKLQKTYTYQTLNVRRLIKQLTFSFLKMYATQHCYY